MKLNPHDGAGAPLIGQKSVIDISQDARTVTITLSAENALPMEMLLNGDPSLVTARLIAVLNMAVLDELSLQNHRAHMLDAAARGVNGKAPS